MRAGILQCGGHLCQSSFGPPVCESTRQRVSCIRTGPNSTRLQLDKATQACGIAPVMGKSGEMVAGRNAITTPPGNIWSWRWSMAATKGKSTGVCAQKTGRWQLFRRIELVERNRVLRQDAIPRSCYRAGVFIAFHKSKGIERLTHKPGYNVVFQPLAGDHTSGTCEVFAG